MSPRTVYNQSEEDAIFGELHNQYSVSLSRFISRRVSDPAACDDLVQQVFERLLRRGDFDSIRNPGAYLFQTAQSVIADHGRRVASSGGEPVPFVESEHEGVDFSPEHVLANRESLDQALRIIDSLPERTRAIFLLRRFEGLKFRDIADKFGISVSAVEKHMERAIRQLLDGIGGEL